MATVVFNLQYRFLFATHINKWVGIAQSVLGLATTWTVLGPNPGGGEIFRTLPGRPWDPPSLL